MKETTDSLHKKIGIVRVNRHLKIVLNYEFSPTAFKDCAKFSKPVVCVCVCVCVCVYGREKCHC